MKKGSFLVLLVSVMFILVACNEADYDVTVGIDTAVGGSPQFRSAQHHNFYTDEELNVQLISFAFGIDIINALMIERVDVGLAADYALLNSLNRGDMVIIGTLTSSTKEIMKKNEIIAMRGIDSPEDLKGKNIAVSNGTVSEYYWAEYLNTIGLTERDVNIVKYTSPDEAIIGMKTGDMDVVMASGSSGQKFKNLEGAKVIDTLASTDLQTNAYLIANRSYAESHSEELAKLITVIAKGNDFVAQYPEEAAEITHNQIKIDAEDALLDIKTTNFVMRFTEEDYQNLSNIKEWLLERGILKQDFDIESKLFLDPLRQALPNEMTFEEGNV
nr:ABC transporter substrate-binding protein [Lysinibacillus timonensis]